MPNSSDTNNPIDTLPICVIIRGKKNIAFWHSLMYRGEKVEVFNAILDLLNRSMTTPEQIGEVWKGIKAGTLELKL